MASVIDYGLLSGRFSFVFSFLLVFALVYGVLTFTKPFKENKGIYALVAFLAGVMTLFSPIARNAINSMAPWFVLLIIFCVFILIILKMFNVSDDDILGALKSSEHSYLIYWMVGLVGVIVIASIANAVSESGGFGKVSPGNSSLTDINENVDTGDQSSAFWATITHPKVLGLALLFLIGAATVQRMTSTS